MSNNNTNLGLTTEAWADIVIKRWEEKTARLNVYHTGELVRSFAHTIVSQANGNPQLIEFAFEYYGKFVDMGVGKGVSIGQVQFSNRKPKTWYSSVFFGQIEKLKEILAEKYARKAQLQLITDIDDNADRHNKEFI